MDQLFEKLANLVNSPNNVNKIKYDNFKVFSISN